jgi:hypothetical protein
MAVHPRTILIAFLGLCLCGVAGGQAIEGDARSGALAGASTALIDDSFTESNFVVAGGARRPHLTLFAGQSYGLSELRIGRIQYVQPLPGVAIVIEGVTFGYDMYRESSFVIGVAREFRALGPRSLYLGAAARYLRVAAHGYGADAATGLSVGMLVSLTPELHLGFHAANMNSPSGSAGQTLAHALSVGFQYQPDDRARLVVDATKDVRFPVSIRAGVELRLAEPFFIRAGFATKPSRIAGGFGVRLGSTSADIALQRHNPLGWSQAASLSIGW